MFLALETNLRWRDAFSALTNLLPLDGSLLVQMNQGNLRSNHFCVSYSMNLPFLYFKIFIYVLERERERE